MSKLAPYDALRVKGEYTFSLFISELCSMEETFKIRAYGYSELAQLYFPHITKKSASVQLRRWILLNKKLSEELLQSEFKPGQKILTPRQVNTIINYLGIP
jgi:hypothetical protein